MDMVIGVDFGNSNSFAAYISGMNTKTRRGGTAITLLPNDYFQMGIPSVVHFKRSMLRDGQKHPTVTFGGAAKNAVPMPNCRDMLKRRLWQTEKIDGYEIEYDDAIVGMIQHIVEIANEQLVSNRYSRCNKISLAFPAAFSRKEKEHLQELAEQAVLSDGSRVQVVAMIEEPVAAALEYLASLPFEKAERDFTVLVYDLGGGTFDTAVVTAHQDAQGVMRQYKVLEQKGIERAGNEFTDAMVNLMRAKYHGIGVKLDERPSAVKRFREDAEYRKCELSKPGTKSIDHETDDGDCINITRAELEKATETLVTETLAVAKEVYDKCITKPTMIVMTGGQSQMPIIKERLQEQFPDISSENIIPYNPQKAIALGAARFASLAAIKPAASSKKITNSTSTPVTTPVVLRSGAMLGLAAVVDDNGRRYVRSLIPRNTEIPMEKPSTARFQPTEPTTTHRIVLVEATTDNPDVYDEKQFKQMAELTIDFNVQKPARPTFELSVYIDQYNKIQFSAHDPDGKFKTVSVTADYSN